MTTCAQCHSESVYVEEHNETIRVRCVKCGFTSLERLKALKHPRPRTKEGGRHD